MDTNWIILVFLGFTTLLCPTKGQSEIEVQLVVRKYVEKGSSVTMHCEHNVISKILHKVTWRKVGGADGRKDSKFFEFINGRSPPFRYFEISGATIDWSNSNEGQVTLKNLDYEAAGYYYCEVSTETPIFTKASEFEQLHVILPQTGPPRILFSKRHFYVGEKLVANCTTSKARPAPHITWLINGKKVDDKHVRPLHLYAGSGKNSHRSKSHQQQHNSPSSAAEKIDIGKGIRSSGGRKDILSHGNGFNMGYNNNGGGGSRVYEHLDIQTAREVNPDVYDNKYYETRKHRNSYNRKYRRYVGDASSSIGGSTGSDIMIGSGGNVPVNNSGTGSRAHRGLASSSELSIEVSELHASINGRLEITCLATIPAHVGVGEQYADYKTYSVKIDIETVEQTSMMPPMSGMAALGNASQADSTNSSKDITRILMVCLFLVFILRNFHTK